MRTEWIKSQGHEMQGLWSRGVFQKVLRTPLTPQDKVFITRFHYTIKRKGVKFDKCTVRLVVQGQHLKRKGADGVGDYHDAFSPVPAASGFRTILSLATQLDMFTDHVDISQAFVQSELLPGDGHNGNVYISSPLGYDEDSQHIQRLLKPLYGMPSAARAWHTTMSAFLEREGCETVGFEKSMWRVVIDGHRILLGAHIDDFVIACDNRPVLDAFRKSLLEAFEGTYGGPLKHYLGCEFTRNHIAGTTTLSQKNYAEEILRSYGFWDILPRNTPMKPNTCLSKDDSNPKPDFHRRYCGIVGSLGYLVTDMSSGARKNKILETLEQNGTFCREQDGWDEQARQNRNQDRNSAVCKTTLACTTLGSASAMLTIVMDVKTMTQSVPMSRLEIVNGTTAGQGTWRCGLPAKFIDREQMSVQELMALKRMPHRTLNGHLYNQ